MTDPLFSRHPRWIGLSRTGRTADRSTSAPYGFAFARTALRWGLLASPLAAGDTVLAPEFVCESLLHPLDDLGLRVDLYPVDDRLEPDWPTLEGRAATAAAVVMVHFFGQPQDAARFRRLCERHGLLLIEDNAHGWGGRTGDDAFLGTLGDISISAPRKPLGTAHGALLVCDLPLDEAAFELPLQPVHAPLGSVDTRPFARALGALGLGRLAPRADASQRLRERRLPDWAMDAEMRRFIDSQDVDLLRRRRQRVYEVWERWSRSVALEPTFLRLGPGASPLAFPAWAASRRAAAQWRRWGRSHRIEIYDWPTLPRSVATRGTRAEEMWSRLLCFPVHHEIDADQLDEHLRAAAPPPYA